MDEIGIKGDVKEANKRAGLDDQDVCIDLDFVSIKWPESDQNALNNI